MILTAKSLDAFSFSPQQCEALFASVLIDDTVDEHTALPEAIHLDYGQEQFTQCFRLCRQVWKAGVSRTATARMIKKIRPDSDLNTEELRSYKHIRAKFKHLRFAYANFDERHQYPYWFDLVTSIMGHLQDAFKNGRAPAIKGYALLLRLLLMPPVFLLVTWEANHFHPSSPRSFRSHILNQIGRIRNTLAKQEITGGEFHETRKIISRLVALYDSLRTLYPSPYHDGISRYLAAINGLMGRLHDELISKKLEDRDQYHGATFPLPDEIRQRLSALMERYPAAS